MSRPPGIRFYSGCADERLLGRADRGDRRRRPGPHRTPTPAATSRGEEGKFTITNLRANQRYPAQCLGRAAGQHHRQLRVHGAGQRHLNLNDVPVFSWFSNLQGKVFYDKGRHWLPVPFGEPATPSPAFRSRSSTSASATARSTTPTVTDDEGNYEFAGVFLFFNWLVAETDFTRFGPPARPSSPTTAARWSTRRRLLRACGRRHADAAAAAGEQQRPWRIFGGVGRHRCSGGASSANLLQNFQGFWARPTSSTGARASTTRPTQRPWWHHRRRALRIDARRVRPEVRDAREQRARAS